MGTPEFAVPCLEAALASKVSALEPTLTHVRDIYRAMPGALIVWDLALLEQLPPNALALSPATIAQAERLVRDLETRPPAETFDAARRAIHLIFESLPADQQLEVKGDLTKSCAAVAAASGGFLGLTSSVSAAERGALDRLARLFEQSHAEAARRVAGIL